ncbi:uncharacterized protein LACBIDRAFT_301618 [Laccaria bicolor S238N-H82]|uniref:Predicted protein n=1 Tax=Laccaria bicolor (strain S238N-H82 / ATCC MYA-4686) TaxID=486041 RepID=B0CNX6_LACBS|nr:uncharacterized protein LACBIDRAFT_301618 [Laccaria bicolor S238N-H82]EDR15370.1 predicted protein [Laccaria bicolor S238N-H82]|eukprot:XP_001873578.1 predicted protein [Laccaria bicolor S238N-H82]
MHIPTAYGQQAGPWSFAPHIPSGTVVSMDQQNHGICGNHAALADFAFRKRLCCNMHVVQ